MDGGQSGLISEDGGGTAHPPLVHLAAAAAAGVGGLRVPPMTGLKAETQGQVNATVPLAPGDQL